MKATTPWGAAVLGFLLASSPAAATVFVSPVFHTPFPSVPNCCNTPPYYVVNPQGMAYGPNYYLYPPNIPFQGCLPAPLGQYIMASWYGIPWWQMPANWRPPQGCGPFPSGCCQPCVPCCPPPGCGVAPGCGCGPQGYGPGGMAPAWPPYPYGPGRPGMLPPQGHPGMMPPPGMAQGPYFHAGVGPWQGYGPGPHGVPPWQRDWGRGWGQPGPVPGPGGMPPHGGPGGGYVPPGMAGGPFLKPGQGVPPGQGWNQGWGNGWGQGWGKVPPHPAMPPFQEGWGDEPMPEQVPGVRPLTPGFPGYALDRIPLPQPGYIPPSGLPQPGHMPPSGYPQPGRPGQPPRHDRGQQPGQPEFVSHPFARSPRDFFMWREVYEDMLVRERRPDLVP